MLGINAIIVIMVLIVYSGRFDILQVLIFGKYDNFFIHKKGLKKIVWNIKRRLHSINTYIGKDCLT
jgi:hypothetical protein